MHPDMAGLCQVKEIELELLSLKGKAEAISIPLERTRARRFAAKKDMIDVQDKLNRLVARRREIDKELVELDTRQKQAEEKMLAVRTPKQAQAQEAEIQSIKTAVAELEDEALSLLEREETLTARIEQLNSRTQRDLAVIDEEMARLENLLEENQRLAKGVREDRIAALNRLSKEVRDNYDWLLRRYGPGQAIVRVDGGACGGCGSILLPDQALKMDDDTLLHRCTHCRRYLLGWKTGRSL